MKFTFKVDAPVAESDQVDAIIFALARLQAMLAPYSGKSGQGLDLVLRDADGNEVGAAKFE